METKLDYTIFDAHCPFTDLESFKIFLDATENEKPNRIIIGGDFMDFYGISRFDNSPSRASDLNYELTCGKELLEKIRQVHAGEIIYIPGNHCARMISFLSRGKNQALFNLACLSLPELLDFKKYGIKQAEGHFFVNENFVIKHGVKCGQNPAQAELMSMGISGMSGHAHKSQTARRNFFNKSLEWHSIGHMSVAKEHLYAAEFSFTWDQSFGRIEYTDKNFEAEIIRL